MVKVLSASATYPNKTSWKPVENQALDITGAEM